MHLDKLTKNLTWLAVLGTVLAGCPADDGSGTTAADTGSTTDPTAGTNPTTTMSMTSAEGSTTAEPGTTAVVDSSGTAAADSSGTAAGTESGGTAATGTGGGEVCAPMGDDDECTACTKEMCCTELEACFANPDCACVVTCIGDSGMGGAALPACLEECMVGLPAEAGPLSACTMACPTC